MTAAADLIRDRRRAFAAPGGAHDGLIAFLAKALPAMIGMIAAVMVLMPLAERDEISFLLDRNRVAMADHRIELDDAVYRGADKRGRAFSVSAGHAVQSDASTPVVTMDSLTAHMTLGEGPAELTARNGAYNYDSEKIDVSGPVNFTAADGYRMVTDNVSIDLTEQSLVGSGGVSGAVPTGTFSADRILADLNARTIILDGNARLRMTPGKLRIPQ